MAVSVQDMQAAMGELRNELQKEFQSVRDAAAQFQSETRQQFLTEKELVSTTVTERLAIANKGFDDEQKRVNGLLAAEHAAQKEAANLQQRELEQMKVELKAAIQKVEAVSDGKLVEVASKLIEQQDLMKKYELENNAKVDTVHQLLKASVGEMHIEFRDRLSEIRQELTNFEVSVKTEFDQRRSAGL